MGKQESRIVVIISFVLLWPYQHMAIGAKPLSVAGIVRLLQELKVSPQRVAEEVKKQGVNFEVTDAVRKQLRDAGADEGLLLAIERESMSYSRKVLEDERRKIEEEKKRAADEAKRRQSAEDAQKAEEDARRKEEAQRKAEERKQREAAAAAERKAKEEADRQEDERRRSENEVRKRTEEERSRTGEMVSVGNFKIDKTEVTVAAYQRCVAVGRCTALNSGGSCNWNVSGRSNHPINCVDWNQAKTYCEWAGKRLPTEEEWKRAAYGTDGRGYPWGNEWDATKANEDGSEDGYEQTAPIGSFPAGASPYGALDMRGNVWEWTASRYNETRYVALGGSWVNVARNVRVAYRSGAGPGGRDVDIGFRCAQ